MTAKIIPIGEKPEAQSDWSVEPGILFLQHWELISMLEKNGVVITDSDLACGHGYIWAVIKGCECQITVRFVSE